MAQICTSAAGQRAHRCQPHEDGFASILCSHHCYTQSDLHIHPRWSSGRSGTELPVLQGQLQIAGLLSCPVLDAVIAGFADFANKCSEPSSLRALVCLQARKDSDLRNVERRAVNARYLSELVKFRSMPFGSFFVLLKVCLPG